MDRATVNLAPKSVRALEQIAALTGESKTDAINRALQLYAFLQRFLDEGGAVLLREAESQELQRLHML